MGRVPYFGGVRLSGIAVAWSLDRLSGLRLGLATPAESVNILPQQLPYLTTLTNVRRLLHRRRHLTKGRVHSTHGRPQPRPLILPASRVLLSAQDDVFQQHRHASQHQLQPQSQIPVPRITPDTLAFVAPRFSRLSQFRVSAASHYGRVSETERRGRHPSAARPSPSEAAELLLWRRFRPPNHHSLRAYRGTRSVTPRRQWADGL